MFKSAAILALVFLVFGGCSTIDNISDENLAHGIYVGSTTAAKHGLKLVFKNNPDKIEQIKADATKAVAIMRSNVLPVFEGATSDVVLRSAVETALNELSSSLTQTTIDTIKLVLVIVASRIELPENPADQLSARTKGAVAAFFRGTADGLEQGIADAPAPTQTRSLVWPK